jgi:hypothetical protein
MLDGIICWRIVITQYANNDSYLKQKIENKYGIPIIILVIVVVIISLLIQYWPSESKEQDKLIDGFLIAVGISVLGVTLMILKQAIADKYITDSLHVLLFVMVPVSVSIPLLADPKISWYFFFIFYGGVIGWFLSVNYFIIKTGVRNDEQQKAASVMTRLFGFLMGLSVFIFFLYFVLIIPQLNYPTN